MASKAVRTSIEKISQIASLSQDDLNILLDDEATTNSVSIISDLGEPMPRVVPLPMVETTIHTNNKPPLPPETQPNSLKFRENMIQQETEYLRRVERLETELERSRKENSVLAAKVQAISMPVSLRANIKQAECDRDTLDQIRNGLAVLVPSDLQYVELQGVPDSKKTLFDQIRCRVYEETYSLRSELSKLRKDRDVMRHTSDDLSTVQHQKQLLEEAVRDRDKRLATIGGQLQVVESDLNLERERNAVLRREIETVDQLKNKADALNVALGDERHDKCNIQQQLQQTTEANRVLVVQKEELSRSIDILKLDKSYLEKEVASFNNRIEILENKLAQRSNELENLKEHQLDQLQSMLQTTEKHRAEYETRLQEELSAIRKRTSLDLDDIRSNMRDMHDREIRMFKEQLCAAQEELKRCRHDLEHYKETLASVTQKYHHEKSNLELKVASIEQRTKTKDFENDRLKLIYEDTLHQVRRLQLENEKNLKKIDIVSREYQDLQMETTRKVLELESRARTKSNAPVQVIKEQNVDGESVDSKNKEIDRLKQEIQFVLGRVKQPQQTLLSQLRDNESELNSWKSKAQDCEQKLNSCMKDRETLIRERNMLLKDMRHLVKTREQTEAIRDMVSKFVNDKAQRNRQPLRNMI